MAISNFVVTLGTFVCSHVSGFLLLAWCGGDRCADVFNCL